MFQKAHKWLPYLYYYVIRCPVAFRLPMDTPDYFTYFCLDSMMSYNCKAKLPCEAKKSILYTFAFNPFIPKYMCVHMDFF